MMPRNIVRVLLGGLAIAAGFVRTAPAQTGPTIAPLTGEQLVGNPSRTRYELRCNTDGSGTLTWISSGAAGPVYTGSFAEAGRISIGTADPTTGLRSYEFSAGFAIYSVAPRAVIFGSKGIPAGTTTLLTCNSFAVGFGAFNLAYDATIITPDGTISDTGRTDMNATATRTFNETFTLSEGPRP